MKFDPIVESSEGTSDLSGVWGGEPTMPIELHPDQISTRNKP